MRAEFRPSDSSEDYVGHAVWVEGGIQVEANEQGDVQVIQEIFRRTPIAVDDRALRTAGTSGPIVLQPGTLQWFLAAARVRGEARGFSVTLIPEGFASMGWDPAASYRTFTQSFERKERAGRASFPSKREIGEERPQAERGPSAPGTEAARPAPGPSAAGHRDGP